MLKADGGSPVEPLTDYLDVSDPTPNFCKGHVDMTYRSEEAFITINVVFTFYS